MEGGGREGVWGRLVLKMIRILTHLFLESLHRMVDYRCSTLIRYKFDKVRYVIKNFLNVKPFSTVQDIYVYIEDEYRS